MASTLTCTKSLRGAGIWYALEALRIYDTIQRGAVGIIAACVGLVFAAVVLSQLPEKKIAQALR